MSTGIDPARIAALFTEVLVKRVENQLYADFPSYEEFAKTSMNIEIGPESYARVPLVTGYNPSVGAKPMQGRVQKGGIAGMETAKIRLINEYGTILAPGKMVRNSSAKAAFADFMTLNVDNTMIALKQDVNRQMHGDGRGILATADPAVTSATLPVSSTRYFTAGMIVDVQERDSGTFATNGETREIVSVNPGVSITLDASVTTAAGPTVTCVYRDEARNVEMNGFTAGIAATDPDLGPLQDVAIADVPEWISTVFDASTGGFGSAASEELFQHVASLMDQAGGHGQAKKQLLCQHAVRDRFVKKLKTQQQFLDPTTLKSGFKTVTWNGNTFLPDKETADNTLLIIDPMFTKIWHNAEFGFIDEDGNRLVRHPQLIDTFMATIFSYLNIGYMKRSANARIHTINS